MSEETQRKRTAFIDRIRSKGYEIIDNGGSNIIVRQRVGDSVADVDVGLFLTEDDFEVKDEAALLVFADVIAKCFYAPKKVAENK